MNQKVEKEDIRSIGLQDAIQIILIDFKCMECLI
jgi:hypothetical protein